MKYGRVVFLPGEGSHALVFNAGRTRRVEVIYIPEHWEPQGSAGNLANEVACGSSAPKNDMTACTCANKAPQFGPSGGRC